MREIVSPISGIRSPFGQRREVSLLALYAANGLNPSLVIDAKTPRYFLDGVQSDLVSVTDHSRASGATYLDSNGVLQTAASGVLRDNAYAYVDGALTGPYVLTEPDGVNLLHSTDALVTQTEEVTAQPYTLQFTGTGTVTLSGAYSGSLVGTGAGEVSRVYLTFTPTAGTLTITVSGTVTDAQLEAGSIPTSYIPNLAGSGSAARAEDVLTIPDAPWPSGDPGSRAIGISMKGLMTYADNDIGGNALGNPAELGFYRQKVDTSNYINVVLSTGGSGTGAVSFIQESNGSLAFADSSSTAYSPGINVPFSIASYHKDNGINGAVDGVALTENTTPTILPDLSATPIAIRSGGGPLYLEEMRIWVESAVDKITDTLIEEASP